MNTYLRSSNRMSFFRDASLRTKLTLSFVVINLLAVGIVGLVVNRITRIQISEQVGSNLYSISNGTASQVSSRLEDTLNTLEVLSLNRFLQDTLESASESNVFDQSAFERLDQQWAAAKDTDPLIQEVINNELAVELKESQAKFANYAEIFVTDKYGSIVASTNRTSDYYQADEEWWQVAWNNGQGSIYIGQPEYDESANINTINIAIPVPGHNSTTLVGVLRLTLNINSITELIGNVQIGQTGHADIIFSNQIYDEQKGVIDLDTKTLSDAKILTGTFGQMTFEDAPSLVSVIPVTASTSSKHKEAIDSLGWKVLIHQDISEAEQPVTATTRSITISALVISFIVALSALSIAQILSNPIVRLTAVAQQVISGDINAQATVESADEIGILAKSFNDMTSRLRDLITSLEERIAARTKDLATVAEIGTTTSSILEARYLLQTVVDLTKERFNLYHSHIYLLDEEGKNLVLTAGAGEPGRIMSAEKRSIPLDREQSLVARAARERKGVTVNDVTQAPDFLPNPLLPNTRSELAVPMIVGNTLVGVFDIQSDQIGRFTESDINIQNTLAAQLATSIQNVRSFEQSRKQAEFEAQVNVIGQKIQRSTSIEETLQTAIRELGSAIGASRVKAVLSGHQNAKDKN